MDLFKNEFSIADSGGVELVGQPVEVEVEAKGEARAVVPAAVLKASKVDPTEPSNFSSAFSFGT